MFSVAPGSSQTASVAEPALDVTVTYGGAAVVPAAVKLSFASTSGTSCTDSWYPTVNSNAVTAGNALLYPGQPFASTATSGSTESASGYQGSYTVCADYAQGSGSSTTYREHSATSVTNTNFAAPTTVNVPITSSSTTGQC
jgi:hypothetical protein